jgi:uncharacterized protein YndB with AHSA1/START domain
LTQPLVLDVHIAASPATVFKFLTSAEHIVQWLGSGARLDGAHEGANLRVAYPNGDIAHGKLLEVVADQRVTYSWGYENNAHDLAPGKSRVIIELTPTAAGTHLTLRHEGLTGEQADAHRLGWAYYLSVLSPVAAGAALVPLAAAAVELYFAAWSEADAQKRLSLLERCWTANGEFLDKSTTVRGRPAFHQHIGAALAFAPGVRLSPDGRVSHCESFVRFTWSARAGDAVLAHGSNFGRIDADGRFLFVVGMPD